MRVSLTLMLVVLLAGCGTAGSRPAARVANGPRHSPRPTDPVRAVVLGGDGRLRFAVRADGPIAGVTADWSGGWFLTGRFTRIDGAPAPALAHVSATGRLEPMPQLPAVVSTWSVQPMFYGLAGLAASPRFVYLTRGHGDSTTYELLVLDARSGAVVRGPVWMPGEVPRVAADRAHLFLDGAAQMTSCLDEYDATGRRLLAHFAVHMLPEVGCLNDVVPAGRFVYLAGSLGVHHDLPGAPVARFTTRDGRLDTRWVDRPVPCRECYGLAYDIALGGGRVFENPGFGRSPWLAAVSQTTGAPIADWRPSRIPGYPAPLGLAYAGGRLFVAGVVPRSGPLAAGRGLITLDARTGALRPSWRPPAGRQPARPVASGNQVLVALMPQAAW